MRKQKRALLEQYIVPGPAPPPSYVDDYQLIQQLDEFSADPTGFEEWIRLLAAEDRERARSILLTVKFKYPDLHRVFLKQRGRNTTDSNLTDLLDRQQPGTVPEDLEEVDELGQMSLVPDSEVTEVVMVETPSPAIQEEPTYQDEYVVELKEKEPTNVPEEENTMRGRDEGERRRRSRSLRRSRDRQSMDRGYMKNYRKKQDRDDDMEYMDKDYMDRDSMEVEYMEKEYMEEEKEYMDRPGKKARRRRSTDTAMDKDYMDRDSMEEEEKEYMDRPSRRRRPGKKARRSESRVDEGILARIRRRRKAAEEDYEYEMMELDDLEEVSDEEVEELDECPVGCVPVMEDEEAEMEEEAEDMEEEAEDMGEEDEEMEDEKEASVQATDADTTVEVEAEPVATEAEEATAEVDAEVEATAEVEEVTAEVPFFEPLAVMAELEALDFTAAENQIDMVLVGSEEDPRYLVVVNGSPVAAIHANSVDMPEEHRGMFFDEDYPKWIMQGIETVGLTKTLDSLNAKYFAAQAFEGDVFKAASEKVAADQDEERRIKLATLKDNLLSHMAIIIEGSLKNYWQDNPLKDSLLSEFKRSGLTRDAAVTHIEAAFRQSGTEYFDFVMTTAAEWLGKPREIIEHYISEIGASNYRFPQLNAEYDGEIAEAPMNSFAGVEPEVDPTPRNVPLRTVGQQHHASSRTFDKNIAQQALMGSISAKAGHKLPPR